MFYCRLCVLPHLSGFEPEKEGVYLKTFNLHQQLFSLTSKG